jgi:hypothetical protein
LKPHTDTSHCHLLSTEESQYQPRYLPKDRAGKPQNLPENLQPLQLFQLLFTVKEIENIIKQTNCRVAYIGFTPTWQPLTVMDS